MRCSRGPPWRRYCRKRRPASCAAGSVAGLKERPSPANVRWNLWRSMSNAKSSAATTSHATTSPSACARSSTVSHDCAAGSPLVMAISTDVSTAVITAVASGGQHGRATKLVDPLVDGLPGQLVLGDADHAVARRIAVT